MRPLISNVPSKSLILPNFHILSGMVSCAFQSSKLLFSNFNELILTVFTLSHPAWIIYMFNFNSKVKSQHATMPFKYFRVRLIASYVKSPNYPSITLTVTSIMNRLMTSLDRQWAFLSWPIILVYLFVLQKTTQLKRMLESSNLEFIMEAHNGLSAKIVQEAGAWFSVKLWHVKAFQTSCIGTWPLKTSEFGQVTVQRLSENCNLGLAFCYSWVSITSWYSQFWLVNLRDNKCARIIAQACTFDENDHESTCWNHQENEQYRLRCLQPIFWSKTTVMTIFT